MPFGFESTAQWAEHEKLSSTIYHLKRFSECQSTESFQSYFIDHGFKESQIIWSSPREFWNTHPEIFEGVVEPAAVKTADLEPYLTEDGFVREVPVYKMEQWYLENMDTVRAEKVDHIDMEDFHVQFAEEIQARSAGVSDVETAVETIANETQSETSPNYTSGSLSDNLPDWGLGLITGVVAFLLLATLFAVLCSRNKSNSGSTRHNFMRRLLPQSQRQVKTKSPAVLSRMLSSMKLEPSIPEMLDTTAALSSEVEQDQNLPMVFGLVFGSTLFLIAAVTYSTRRFQSKSSVTSKHQAPRVIIAH